jgi:hypothetical protein
MSEEAHMPRYPGPEDRHWERWQAEMLARGSADGLPLVPPTPERMDRMLGRHGVAAEQVLCDLAPAFSPVSWRDLALHAVLAGCQPDYLPVLAAAVQAITAPEFNLIGIATTTGSAATLVIVSGPVACRIGMNAGSNALGGGNRANATIGRALRLLLQNVGGAKSGEIDMATLGQPAKIGFCFAENEAQSPWEPLHVERGYQPDASVVTVVGCAGIVEVVDSCSRSPADLAQTFAQSMTIAGSLGGAALLGGGEPVIVLPPELAHMLAQAGCSKDAFKRLVWERALLPLERLSPAVCDHLLGRLDAAVPAVLGQDALRVAAKATDILLVVAGGIGVKAAYIPTWGGSTRAVSRPISD